MNTEYLTAFSRIPNWIARSGKKLSATARLTYVALMSYADNETLTAFPSQELLAEDVGVSIPTIKRAVKELAEAGAIVVQRRRNQSNGNFYANHYTLIFDPPGITGDTPRGIMGDPITRPTTLTKPTIDSTSIKDGHTISRLPQGQTSEQTQTKEPRFQAYLPKEQWEHLKDLLLNVATQNRLNANHGGFYSDPAQEAHHEFCCAVEDYTQHFPFFDELAHIVWNETTIDRNIITRYDAGVKLMKLFNLGQQSGVSFREASKVIQKQGFEPMADVMAYVGANCSRTSA